MKQFASALDKLNELLLGEEFHIIEFGDCWSLSLSNGLWLVAQNFRSTEEVALNTLLHVHPGISDAVDNEDIAKAIVLLKNRRKTITNVRLSDTSELILSFEGGGSFTVPTDTGIVDWQWGINKSGADPYSEAFIACFNAAEIFVHENANVSWGPDSYAAGQLDR